MSESDAPRPGGEIIVYPLEDGGNQIRVLLEGETVWLTQQQMAALYNTSKQNISLHTQNIYEDGELVPKATVKQYLTVRQEGNREVKRALDHYNLAMILAVGYRVRSSRGVQFRQWATARLSEYLVKGFTLDDERLKGGGGVVDHFDELLARIREIRASEARVYQRIREIFSLAADYREGAEETNRFFAFMQNKMHFAATGLTAAEIIRKRADAGKPNMGATTWRGNRLLKRDVSTAKNYLDAKEIDTLNRITVMFLDQAEFRAERRQDIRMADWEAFLDKFLRDTELPVLSGPGKVSREAAIEWAEEQYDAFAERRQIAAESEAETRYVEDLRTSVKMLEAQKKKPTAAKKNAEKKTSKKSVGTRKPKKEGGA